MRDTATPHTPGPWRAVKFKDTKSWSLYANAGSLGNIRDEGDARLAAAAPELLEALKMARQCIAYCRKSHADVQSGEGIPVELFIDAAIAKATGDAK